MNRKLTTMAAALLASTFAGITCARVACAETINLADVAELSGSGATVGTNWKNGIDLAVEEINAKGGILGAKIVVTHADSQSNAGTAKALVEKALDSEPYALLGPGYSGSVKVTEPLAAEAGIAEIMGGEAAELTKTGNKFVFRTSFGQQSSMPKIAKYIAETMKAKTVADSLCQQRLRQGRPRHDHEGIRRARRQSRRSTIRPKRGRRILPPTRSR